MEFRSGTNADRPALAELAQRVADADGVPAVGEHVLADIATSDLAPSVFGWAGGGLGMVAVLTTTIGAGWWGLELVVDPARRTRADIDRLRDETLDVLRSKGATGIRGWTYSGQVAESLLQSGFEEVRAVLQLGRTLPGQLPLEGSGLEWTQFVESDLPELLELHNLAFAAGGGAGDWSEEEMRRRMHLSWFRPEGLTIARRLGAMVGYCWTKRHSDSVGEIYVIAVHPAAVGQGVGRALLRRGMELLSEAGCQKAIVYVDGANERAIALYASEGFTLNRTERVLELQLSD